MAIRRSRGVRSLTTLPPIRISPEVGSSRPAIMRSSVVFPEPEGPKRTRNSPSRLSKSTPTTAPTWPWRKTLVSARVWTIAIPRSLPLVEDPLDLLLGRARGVLRTQHVLGRLGEHRRDDEGVEDLVDRGGRVAGVTDVGRPIEDSREHLVLVGRSRLRVVRELLVEVRHRRREAREIVELARLERRAEAVHVVDEELLGAILVLREVPDDVAIHHVLGGDAA